jgi:putative membrane protein
LKSSEPVSLLIVAVLCLGISSIHPYDRTTWLLETFPILIAIALLTTTYRRFPLTPLVYRLIFLHSIILMVGGYYTYARVPIGAWVQSLFDLGRNHFDRLGHFAQGFVPAVIAREILLRTTPLKQSKMLFFIVVSICLAISAFYEFIEWWAAAIMGQAADDFLGTQGDPWDTQWDMFMAFTGAIMAQLVLARRHDRELESLYAPGKPEALAADLG